MEDFVGGARTGLEKNDAPVSALLWAELITRLQLAARRTGNTDQLCAKEEDKSG